MDHLEVLRWTIFRSAVAIVVGMIVAFCYKRVVFDSVILAPQRADFITYRVFCSLATRFGFDQSFCMQTTGFTLLNTHMSGQFMTHLTVSFVLGAIIAVPYVLWEVWRFVKPALKTGESSAVRGVVFFSSILFLLGVTFGYFVLVPMSLQFLGTYNVSPTVPNMVDLDSYIGTVTSLTLWTGVVFELPLIILFLTRIGFVGTQFLRTYRKHSYLIILIVAAIITPPDVTSQILVSLPLVALYEGSILLAARTERLREKAARTQIASR